MREKKSAINTKEIRLQNHKMNQQIEVIKKEKLNLQKMLKVAKVQFNFAGKQKLAKKLDAQVQELEEKYEKISHFEQNNKVYDIVESALEGNVHNMATVVCHLVQLHQRRQKAPKNDISSML